MPRLSRRHRLPLWAAVAILAAALLPHDAAGWGTLTGGLHLAPAELADMRALITNYAEEARRAGLLTELDARTGAHPVHQFIVQQALMMLAEDPAVKGQPAVLPGVRAVNAWDGVERCEHGMKPRVGAGLVHDRPDLTPVLAAGGGPGPDAELSTPAGNPFAPGGVASTSLVAAGLPAGLTGVIATLGYNPFYNGRAHYYSPWLDDGQAPSSAATNYSRLVTALDEGLRGDLPAHYAAYLGHYLSDPVSAKHADAFTLDAATLTTLIDAATRWVAEKTRGDLRAWLATAPITDAIAALEKRTAALSPGGSAAYWRRVNAHIADIGATPLFTREGHYVWMAPSTLRTAVACYLHELASRPAGKSLDAFYTYFDPFYFNGPIFQTKVEWTAATYNPPSFATCTPFSEHLFWETNPAQATLVQEGSGKDVPLLGAGDPKAQYLPWKPAKDFLALDAETARLGLEATMADLVRRCSTLAHGGIDDAHDFQREPKAHLELAIRCVATAYRASISALRLESWGRRVNDRADIRLQLQITTAGGVPAKLKAARVSYRDATTRALSSRPGWTFALDDRAVGAAPLDLGVLVEGVPEGVSPTDLVVELRADFGELPDAGRARARVTARATETVRNPTGGAPVTTKGPVDAIIVMDTTGSMTSSIDSLRRNAIASIRKMRERTSDIRLAVVTFRDLGVEADRPHFKVRPFSRDLEAQFAFLDTLRADGGGDTPEDQLHGISLGLRLWESETPDPDRVPAKVIIVVTDAPAKAPDSVGNDFDSIAARAFAVDPAHVYPIVVGGDGSAAAHGRTLAEKTGGRTLSAASGEEVADAVLAAVDDAVVAYAGPAGGGGGGGRVLFLVLGVVLVVASVGFAALAGRTRRRAAAAAAAVGGGHG